MLSEFESLVSLSFRDVAVIFVDIVNVTNFELALSSLHRRYERALAVGVPRSLSRCFLCFPPKLDLVLSEFVCLLSLFFRTVAGVFVDIVNVTNLSWLH
jgi:hypothetical protein